MGRTKLKKTKRDNSILLQGWFNRDNPEENEVLIALDKISDKHPNLTTKAIIGYSILSTAEKDGIQVQLPVSGTQIMKSLKSILSKLDNLVSSGHMTRQDAAQFVGFAEQAGVNFEELDSTTRSLARNYTGFSFEDEEG